MLVVDAAGAILAANRAFVQQSGFPVAELERRHLSDLVTCSTEEWAAYLTSCAQSRELLPGSFALRRADGTPFECRSEAGLVCPRQGEKPALILLRFQPQSEGEKRSPELRDRVDALTAEVARRQQLEVSLRQSEARLQSLADAMPLLAWIAHADGYIHWYNQRWYEYTGATPAEMEGWGWQSVHDPEVLPNVMARWVECINTAQPFEMVFPLRGKDGTFRSFLTRVHPFKNEQGEVIRWFGTNTDIEAQKRVEDALRKSESRLRRIFDARLVGLLYTDMSGGIVEANDKYLEMVGYTREELKAGALNAVELTPREHQEITRAGLRQVREQGLAPLYEKEYLRKDGTRIPVLIGLTLLEEDQNIAVAFVLDLTPQKQTEAELSAANARLTQALARERNIAVALQRSLTQMPAQDVFAGLQVHALYEPAWEEADVGGDFTDAFPLDEQRMVVVVGDVSGKGLGAAAQTAEIKYTLRGMLYERHSPAAALTGLNEYLSDARRRGVDSGEEFVCISIAVVEGATGRVTLSVAGSEPPLYVRLDGSTEEVEIRGTPLGIFADLEYREEEKFLNHGDLLVLTTDGITEARRAREFFGYEGLVQAATRHRHTAALSELAINLLKEAREFAGGALHDDTCLLLVRRP